MSEYVPARLVPLLEFADVLTVAARESAKAIRKVYREHTRKSRGSTLRPGPDTPLWNELAKLAAGHLERYGDKANLARILGVPRQRVHEYLVAKTTCPDTERALMLLAWVLNEQQSRTTTKIIPSAVSDVPSAPAPATEPPPKPVSPKAKTSPTKTDKKGVTYYVTLVPPSLD